MNFMARNDLIFDVITDSRQPGFAEAFRLYECSFPPGERDGKKQFEKWFKATKSPESLPYDFLLIARLESKIVGMATMHYIKEIEAGFLGYFVIVPEERDKGIGQALANETFNELVRIHNQEGDGSACLGIFGEIDHYRANSIIRRKRIIFWQRLGLRPLQVAWRYPQLRSGTKPSAMYLAFKSLRLGVPPFSRDQLQRITREIYARIYKNRRSDKELNLITRSIKLGPKQICYRKNLQENY
jgi:GNAT superfamily N-acetyltransferase